jgi:hypothetical protein
MPDVRIDVYADTHGAPKQLNETERALDGVEKGAGKSDKTLGGLWKQFAAGQIAVDLLKKAYEALKDVGETAIKGAIDQEKAENNLRTALEISGRTVEGNIQHYLQFAEAQMALTTYTDEEIEAAQALILTFVNLDQKGIDRATKGAMGLATVMGVDLQSAMKIVEKALGGQYGALGRVGIRVSENMTAEQKQASILSQLERLYTRSTKETETFGGSLKQLEISWGELLETAGTAVIKNEAVRDAIKDLKAWIDKLAASPEFKEWIEGASSALTEFLPKFVNTVAKVIEYAGKAAQGIQDASNIMKGSLFFQTGEIPFKEQSKAARKEADDFVASLKNLHPQMREVQAAMEAGRDNWAAYVKWMREADGKAAALADQNKKLIPAINETGTATRILTADELKAIEVKKKLAEAAQAIISKYNPLRGAMADALKQEEALTKARAAGTISAADYKAGMEDIAESLKATTEKLGGLKPTIVDLDKTFQALMATVDNLPLTAEEVAAAMSEEFKDLRDEMQKDFEKLAMKDLPAHLQNIPAASKDAANATKTVWQECSTVIADSMRDIASTIIGAFDIKGLFGAAPKAVKFDSSYYDEMVKAATSAYEKTRSLMEASSEATINAANEAYRAQELTISRAEEDEDRARSRHEDAEDRKYEGQYERDRKAIENSKMTEAQKEAALDALERKFEAAKLAREIARENAKVARDRAREDARYARQEAEERKIEAIRAAGLKKLLDLQNAHQADLDAIRVKEDAAREAQARAEETRQNSLWFKVKGIFATACENMATIFLTKMFTPVGSLIGDLASKLVGKGKDSVGGALDGVGGKVKGLGATIGEFISGIGAGIGGFISGLAAGVGAAIVTLATAIASAATILAAAAPALVVVGLIAVGVFATIATLKRLIGGASGTGAGDGMGRVVERQDNQISLLTQLRDLTIDNRGQLEAMKKALWAISTAVQHSKDYLKSSADYLKTIASKGYLSEVVKFLKSIEKKLPLPGGASGAISTQTQLMVIHGTKSDPEYIFRGSQLGGLTPAPVNLTIPFYLDGKKLDERMLRIANGRVEWLHSQYQRSNRLIPPRSIGGA